MKVIFVILLPDEGPLGGVQFYFLTTNMFGAKMKRCLKELYAEFLSQVRAGG
jgi:hypothetical protein